MDVLLEKYLWKPERIFLLGFSQGGIVAVDLGMYYREQLGGVIVVSDFMLEEIMSSSMEGIRQKNINILVTLGTKDPEISVAQLKLQYLQKYLTNCTVKMFPKAHEMINSAAETRDIMAFISERMYLRNIALENTEGIIDLSNKV